MLKETEKIGKKKMRRDVQRKEIRLGGLDATMDGAGDIIVRVPVIQYDRFDGRCFSDEFLEYCRNMNVGEELFDDMLETFYDNFEKKAIAEYLMEHMRG